MKGTTRRWCIVVLCLLILMLLAMGFVRTVLTIDHHDDHMYLTASVLTSTGSWPYLDFPYLQMPYLPLVYGAIFSLTGLSYVYLQSQLLTFISFILFVTGWFVFCRVVGLRSVPALLATGILLSYPYFEVPLLASSNWVWELTGLIWTWVFFMKGLYQHKRTHFFIAGIICGLAAGFRLSALFWLPVLLIAIGFLTDRQGKALGFCGGWGLGIAPAALLFILNPVRFYFYNVSYHFVNSAWYEMVGTHAPMTGPEKFRYILNWATRWEHLVLGFGAVAVITLVFKQGDQVASRTRFAGWVVFVFSLLGLLAVQQSPLHKQYFLTFSLSAFFLLPVILGKKWFNGRGGNLALFGVLGFFVIRTVWMFQPLIPLGLNPGEWPAVKVHRINLQIESELERRDLAGPVLSLAPAYLAEMPERLSGPLASGIFLFRSGGELSPEQRRRYRVVTEKNLDLWLPRIQPSAVLTMHGDVDRPLKQWAEKQNGPRQNFRFNSRTQLELFLGPFGFDQEK